MPLQAGRAPTYIDQGQPNFMIVSILGSDLLGAAEGAGQSTRLLGDAVSVPTEGCVNAFV
jgi:hypothetical protein